MPRGPSYPTFKSEVIWMTEGKIILTSKEHLMLPGPLYSRVAEILGLRKALEHCVMLRYYANTPCGPDVGTMRTSIKVL